MRVIWNVHFAVYPLLNHQYHCNVGAIVVDSSHPFFENGTMITTPNSFAKALKAINEVL
jgi:hypothetical protein